MFRPFGHPRDPNDDAREDHDPEATHDFLEADDALGDATSLSDSSWDEGEDEDDDEDMDAEEGLEIAHTHWRLGNLG